MNQRQPRGTAGLFREQRRVAGLTQRQLAEAAGLSVGMIRDLEQGRISTPRPESLRALTFALGLDQSADLASAAGQRPGWLARPANGTGQAVSVRLAALGPLMTWRNGVAVVQHTAQRQAVLGLLALHANTGVHRDAIIDALWAAAPVATAANSVQAHVSVLRRALDPGRPPKDPDGLLVSTGTSYRLQVSSSQLDLLAFEEIVGQARAMRASDPAAACVQYTEALGLWRGTPVSDVDLLRGHRAVTELTRQHAAVVAEFADVALAIGRHDLVLPHLRALADREPLNEAAHTQLMMALAGRGQQAAALEVYEELRHRLDDQLGVGPGPQLTDAHLRILRQEIPVAAGPLAAATRPRPGNASPVVPRQLPAAVPHFTGRTAELQTLTSLLEHDSAAIPVLVGTAGVGKTTLAVHWAHQVARQFPDGQLYVNLRGFDPDGTPATPDEAIRGFLGALGVAPERIPATLDGQAALYRSLLASRRVLVILDNAAAAQQVRPLLPGGAGNMVVVTSRNQLAGLVAIEGARCVGLDVLSKAEAWQLLAGRLGTARLAAGPYAAAELIDLCARLPLALAVAAARAAVGPGVQLSDLVSEMRDVRSRLDALDDKDPVASVRVVFSWSYQNLSVPAARLFRLLGVHPGPDISTAAAASLAALSQLEAHRLLGELTSCHLLAESAADRFAFHDLLRAYAAEQADIFETDAQRTAARTRLLDHYLQTAHSAALLLSPFRDPITLNTPGAGTRPEQLDGYAQAMDWFIAEHQVLLAVVGHAAATFSDVHAWQLPWALAAFLERQGHWRDLAATQSTALAAAERLGDLAAQAHAHRNIGNSRFWLGNYDDAQAHLSRTLDLYGQLGDRDSQARTELDVARVFEFQSRYREALRPARDALRLFQAAGNQVGQAYALNAVGWYHAHLDDQHRALDCCQQALELASETGDQLVVSYIWDSLGYARHQLGQYTEAIACYEHALRLGRELGGLHDQAVTLTNLGDTYRGSGDHQAARDAWQQALDILDDLGHQDAAEVRAKLASLSAAP